MGNREDGDARFALGRVEDLTDVQGYAFHPGGKAGRGHQIVERKQLIDELYAKYLDRSKTVSVWSELIDP